MARPVMARALADMAVVYESQCAGPKIGSRGGCACAGPYALRLLGIAPRDASALERALVGHRQSCEVLRPGFSRVSFPYFVSGREVEYVLRACVPGDLMEAGTWRGGLGIWMHAVQRTFDFDFAAARPRCRAGFLPRARAR